MRKINFLALLALSMFCQITFAQTAEEKAWMDYMTPGAEQNQMAAEVGTWYCQIKLWDQADMPPLEATATCTIKMFFDGRYQELSYDGDIMGMEYAAKSIIAYDNALKQYNCFEMDNMGTGLTILVGTPSKDTKSIVYKGTMTNPVEKKPNNVRVVYTFVDANTRKKEIFDIRDGKELKNMEIIMRRKS